MLCISFSYKLTKLQFFFCVQTKQMYRNYKIINCLIVHHLGYVEVIFPQPEILKVLKYSEYYEGRKVPKKVKYKNNEKDQQYWLA